MFGGMLIIIASMIFLLANFYRADSVVSWWLPFLITGVVLVYLGIFLKPGSYRSGR